MAYQDSLVKSAVKWNIGESLHLGFKGIKTIQTHSKQNTIKIENEKARERKGKKTIKITKQLDSDRVQQRYKLNKKEAAFQFSQKLPAI